MTIIMQSFREAIHAAALAPDVPCRRPVVRTIPSGAVRGATLQKRANRAASETRRSAAVG